MKDRVLRYFTYFRRGNSVYLLLLISFANFLVIQYRLLIGYIPLLQELFVSFLQFTLIFTLSYIIIAVLVGWWDFKRGAVIMDGALHAKANPFTNDSVEATINNTEGLIAFIKGDYELATKKFEQTLEIMQKWRR